MTLNYCIFVKILLFIQSMIRLSHIIIAISLLVFGFHSCQKDGLEINGWSPELVSPIINATITMADLIPERGTTEYDENNLNLSIDEVRNGDLFTYYQFSFY